MENIPFNVPYVAPNTLENISASLMSQKLAGDGPFTEQATLQLEKLLSAAQVLLTPSCTHALELAMRLLNLEAGDEIIVPSYTFTSTANAIVLAGGVPVFVDIEGETQNIDVSRIPEAITSKTRAVFCINYAGINSNISELASLCKEYRLELIEDNAHGLGAYVENRALGTFGSLATQSFHETKNVNCGEGGCLVINDLKFAERAEIIREKGTNRSRFFRGQIDKYTWVEAGSSWLLADPLAAMLCAQLDDFDAIQTSRHNVWNVYHNQLSDWSESRGISTMSVPLNVSHPAHMFYLNTNSLEERTSLISHLKENGVMGTFHYQPLHSSDAGRRYGRATGSMRQTDKTADCLIRLPLWAGMSESQIDQVVSSIQEFKN